MKNPINLTSRRPEGSCRARRDGARIACRLPSEMVRECFLEHLIEAFALSRGHGARTPQEFPIEDGSDLGFHEPDDS
jgi:hypothetical protein